MTNTPESLYKAGGDEDHSIHDERTVDGHGRGASLQDAAQRGRKDSPMQEPMPYSPYGDLDSH